VIISDLDAVPVRAWRKRRVICAVEGCSLLTYSLTVPFGKTLAEADWVARLASDLDELDWGDNASWDGVEMAGFNGSMGRQCRFAIFRAPASAANLACDVAWPIEAGLVGESEAMMMGDHPDAPEESCENLGWLLIRGHRLTVLVCRDGRPVHWCCEDEWHGGADLEERVSRFATFARKDALLGGAPLRWFVSGDPSFSLERLASILENATVCSCDLLRGLKRLESSPLGMRLPNLAVRAPSARKFASKRLWFWSQIAILSVALVIASVCAFLWFSNQRLRETLSQERSASTVALDAHRLRDLQRDSLSVQYTALAAFGQSALPGWDPSAWLSAFGRVVPKGAQVESLLLEHVAEGYRLVVLLNLRDFSEADALAKAVSAIAGVRGVRAGDRKSGPDGVRVRLEVDL